MTTQLDDAQKARLSKKVQEYIKDIEQERFIAIRALNEYIDGQTPSPFYIEDALSTGETQGPTFKRVYIQTHKMTIEHQGVYLTILLRDDHIDMQWSTPEHRTGDVALIPTSYQSAKLVSKKYMR